MVMTNLLALDVGTKRIGVAAADDSVPIALPLMTIDVDGGELSKIQQLIKERSINTIVIGYPRNQSGDATAQTRISQDFAEKLQHDVTIVFQDESLTSVMAEDRLKADGRPYDKAAIDAMAAAIILQDYLEAQHA
jgi:putative holliday junction resolvase|tara:strand:- start:409 stop:813 length:405 start_codon:yes stop_codon:yes gene_type:complete